LAAEARRSPRVTVNFTEVRVRQMGGRSGTTELHDLSNTGFCASWPSDLQAGQRIWLTLPELCPLMATVIWNSGTKVGCCFDVPLHSAVLYRLITVYHRS
jgi:hypothetical protein